MQAEANLKEKLGTLGLQITTLLALVLAFFHLYTAAFGLLPALKQRDIHLTIIMAIAFLIKPAKKETLREQVTDLTLALLSLAVGLYFYLRFDPIAQAGGRYLTMDIVAATVLVALLTESTRRFLGWSLGIMSLGFFVYCWFGQLFPGILWHTGFSYARVMGEVAWTSQGLFGTPLGVSATYIVMFVFFASFLKRAKINDLFNNLAISVLGRVRGGPAQVAIVSSCAMGMLTGSNVVNVVTVGPITVPLMKKIGMDSVFAGAVEAVASSGGQIMPPIMGAGAFIMAEMLGIPYVTVAAAALVPALLYYVNLAVVVYSHSRKLGLEGMRKEDIVPLGRSLKKIYLITPLLIVVLLMVWGYTPLLVGLIGIAATIVISYLSRETRIGWRSALEALVESIKDMVPVALSCAIIGIFVDAFVMTGIGVRLGFHIIELAGGSLLIILILTMIISLILGLGAPTTAAYLGTIVVAGPILAQLGIAPLIAHMFAFYFGCLSAITPPFAISAYAVAPIAQANPDTIGWKAFRLSFATFIVPFAFVYNPSLITVLSGGFTPMGLVHVLGGFTGIIAFAFGMEGFISKRMAIWERAAYVIGGLLLISPLDSALILSPLMIGVATINQFLKNRQPTAFNA